MLKVVYEGWMVRHGRKKIGRSYIYMRYFLLETRLLAYYKRKPQDNVVPIKTLLIDGNCWVGDKGLKTHHGHETTLGHKSNYYMIGFLLLNSADWSRMEKSGALNRNLMVRVFPRDEVLPAQETTLYKEDKEFRRSWESEICKRFWRPSR